MWHGKLCLLATLCILSTVVVAQEGLSTATGILGAAPGTEAGGAATAKTSLSNVSGAAQAPPTSAAATVSSAQSLFSQGPQAIMTIMGGMSFMHLDADATFRFGNTLYQYDPNAATTGKWLYGLFLGTELPSTSAWLGAVQLGLAYFQAAEFRADGIFKTSAAPGVLFPYSYSVSPSQVLALVKILILKNIIYHPYISGGLGAAFNAMHNWPPTLTLSPFYSNYTNYGFSWAFGAGVDIDAGKHFRFGLGWQFNGLGQGDLGSGFLLTNGDLVSHSLLQPSVHANYLFVQLSVH